MQENPSFTWEQGHAKFHRGLIMLNKVNLGETHHVRVCANHQIAVTNIFEAEDSYIPWGWAEKDPTCLIISISK